MFSLSNAEELRQRAMQSQQAQEHPAPAFDSKEEAAAPCDGQDPGAAGPRYTEEETRKTSPTVVAGGGGDSREEDAVPAMEGEAAEEATVPAMSPEQIEEFFRSTIERLTSPEEREEIKAKVTAERRIPAILIQIQHDQLEKMGVSQEQGQEALNRYSRIVATADDDAHRKIDEFTHACQRTYIEVLRELEPENEEGEAKLTPEQIMEFFEACDTLLALPETKESLRRQFLETESPPDETIVGMQRSMLRTLGFAPDHGVACLNRFSQDYPDDFKLQMRLRQFMQCASMARQEAILGKEEMTKRMQMHQAMAMRERKMAMELKALDDVGKKELRRKVSEMQRKHALAVMTLSTQEERLAYVKGIPPDEQWEISKLKMLTMQEQAASHGGHSHSHGHGQPSMGHNHGHNHGPMHHVQAMGVHQGGHAHEQKELSSHHHDHEHLDGQSHELEKPGAQDHGHDHAGHDHGHDHAAK